MVAAAVIGAGVASAAVGAVSSSNAAGAQANAANKSINAQATYLGQTEDSLNPYLQTGTQANTALSNGLGLGGSNPFSSPLLQAPQSPTAMTESQLQQTPGYQFNLSQGLESVQNSAAARGLGVSGAALKGAANYATGLADSTYQNQFNNQQTLYSNQVTNQTNQFNRLLGLTQLGDNTATGLGNIRAGTAAGVSNSLIGAGNAQAAGDIATGNAISSAFQTVPQGLVLNQLLGGGGSGGFNPMSGQANTNAGGY